MATRTPQEAPKDAKQIAGGTPFGSPGPPLEAPRAVCRRRPRGSPGAARRGQEGAQGAAAARHPWAPWAPEQTWGGQAELEARETKRGRSGRSLRGPFRASQGGPEGPPQGALKGPLQGPFAHPPHGDGQGKRGRERTRGISKTAAQRCFPQPGAPGGACGFRVQARPRSFHPPHGRV